jgi:hypothetical protein
MSKPSIPAEVSALMSEAVRVHLAGAETSFRRSFRVVAVVAAVGALALGALTTSPVIFLGTLMLFGGMALPIPLAVRYVNTSRARLFQSKFTASPEIVASVSVGLVRGEVKGAAGEAAMAAIYAGKQRALIITTAGEHYALMLPAELAVRLAEAYKPYADFDTVMAATAAALR